MLTLLRALLDLEAMRRHSLADALGWLVTDAHARGVELAPMPSCPPIPRTADSEHLVLAFPLDAVEALDALREHHQRQNPLEQPYTAPRALRQLLLQAEPSVVEWRDDWRARAAARRASEPK